MNADERDRSTTRSIALLASGLVKQFPGVRALDGAALELRTGEVHAIVGENGAGKSTLIQTLGGVYRPDAGSIVCNGREVHFATPREASASGIEIVYQELSLAPQLTVLENVFPATQLTNRIGLIDRRATRAKVLALMAEWGFDALDIKPDARVADLSIAKQQLVEILKVLATRPSIVAFDEPTSSLGSVDAAVVFRVIRRLRDQGVAVIYITHDVREALDLVDRVTVMRDGRAVATGNARDVDEDWVVTRMVGRQIQNVFGEQRPTTRREPLLRVTELSDVGTFTTCTFEVGRGEIVGLAGLIGAGRTELARAIAGHGASLSGSVSMTGQQVRLGDPQDAHKAGIAYVTEDRRSDGLFLGMSVAENLAAHGVIGDSGRFLISASRAKIQAREIIAQFGIVTPSEGQIVGRLSGGNQQKVLLASRLQGNPKLLIVDEPTRGVDIGARQEIYELLRRLADEGMAILMISSDMLEVIGISDRILVMRAGRLVGELPRAEASEERIIGLATGAGSHANYRSDTGARAV